MPYWVNQDNLGIKMTNDDKHYYRFMIISLIVAVLSLIKGFTNV